MGDVGEPRTTAERLKEIDAKLAELEARLGRAAEEWRLVERYCESFKDDDFRLVFKKGDAVLEISVGKEAYDSFSSVAVLVEQEKEQP